MNSRVIEELIITQRVGASDSTHDGALLRAFAKEIVKQNERFDELTQTLFALELMIPGLYVIFLQIGHSVPILLPTLALLCWTVALGITLFSFFPKQYRVMPTVVRWQTIHDATDSLSVEEYYVKSIKHKRRYLVYSAGTFLGGILFAGLTLWF
jgi:hypothetical protein